MKETLKSQCLAFSELSVAQLYQLLKLRSDVFVVEQNCVYPDIDNKDIHPHAIHVLLSCVKRNKVFAYARCLPPELSYTGSSIGRVVVAQSHRGTGAAQELMSLAIATCQQRWPRADIEIGAQLHLTKFYEGFGFVASSQAYDEDGIMHIDMRMALEQG